MANNTPKIIISLRVSIEQKAKLFSYIEQEEWDLINNTEEQGNDEKIEPVSGTVDSMENENAFVVSLVREKYPNPKNIPYMGHMWV